MVKKNKVQVDNLELSSAGLLTLSDRRLYNYMLYHAFDQLDKQTDFEITLSELTGIFGTGLPPVDRLKESLRRLFRTIVEFQTADRYWIMISLLEKVALSEDTQCLSYSYPPDAKLLFLDPILLEKCLIQAHFTQKYSNLLYEILASAHYAGDAQLSIEIADLRSRLQIAENKLTNYSDLDRFVLLPACKEINAHASFAIKYTTQRKGMKVTHVSFFITEKRNISFIGSAKHIIPPKRPRLFIDNPELEAAYAYILNVETPIRQKYFVLACQRAKKHKKSMADDLVDRPDLWLHWVEAELIKAAL